MVGKVNMIISKQTILRQVLSKINNEGYHGDR